MNLPDYSIHSVEENLKCSDHFHLFLLFNIYTKINNKSITGDYSIHNKQANSTQNTQKPSKFETMPSFPALGPGVSHALQGQTLPGFLSSLVTTVVLFLCQFVAFLIMRPKLPHIYAPKLLLTTPANPAVPVATGVDGEFDFDIINARGTNEDQERYIDGYNGAAPFAWLKRLFTTSLDDTKATANLDEFFFLRFVRMLMTIFALASVIVVPVLLPLNWLSGPVYPKMDMNEKNVTRDILHNVYDINIHTFTLDTLTWSHISPHHANRLTVHLVLVVLFVALMCTLIYKELHVYVRTKHAVLATHEHRHIASAATILLLSVPEKYLEHVSNIHELFAALPGGGVRHVWINRDYGPLILKIKERDRVFHQLETFQTRIITKCQQNSNVREENQSVLGSLSSRIIGHYSAQPQLFPLTADQINTNNNNRNNNDKNLHEGSSTNPSTKHSFESLNLPGRLWNQYMPTSNMPRVSLPLFHILGIPVTVPFLSPTIDALTWHKAELNRLNAEVHTLQRAYRDDELYTRVGSCFVQFHDPIAAHLACQAVVFTDPQLAGRGLSLLEIDPRDVKWDNLDVGWKASLTRHVIVSFLNAALIVGWTFPVAVIAVLSQIDFLPELVPGFGWVDAIPPQLRLMASGVLPAIVISLVMGWTPAIFRFFARLKALPTHTAEQLDVQSSLFPFLFTQVFLVVAISRGTIAIFAQIVHLPFSVLTLLAYNVPKGANFFYSYIFLQGFSVAGECFLQGNRLTKMYIWRPLFERTARDRFATLTILDSLDWGSLYPRMTVLAVIGMVYMVIAPLICVFASLSFGMLYLAFKYRILFCNSKDLLQNQSPSILTISFF